MYVYGVCNLINLSTLKNPYGSFLLKSKDIKILTNLKDLLQPIDTIYKNKNAVIFGDSDFKNHKNKYWMNSGDKRKAFRDAQMQIKIKYKEPYYWGAFIIIGF